MVVSQYPLFPEDTATFEIKKHSSIVQMGNITTLQERKAMNALIRIARDQLKRNPEARVFTCEIGILKRLSGMRDNDNAELKEALRTLHSLKFEFNVLHKDDSKDRKLLSFMSEVGIREEGKGKPTTISFEFPTSIREAVRNPNMYVKLDLLVIRGLESKHSIALYEVLKDYMNLWKFRFEIEDFKRLMGIRQGQYSNFTMLKKRVLDVAMQEINNKTDIQASYELERLWRQATAILFKMQPKNKVTGDVKDSVRKKLKFYGVSPQRIEELLQRHDLQYLQANITIAEEQIEKGDVQNPTAYLLKALQVDYRQPENEYSKQQKEEAELAGKAKAERQAADERLESTKANFIVERKEMIVQAMQSLSEEKTAWYKAAFLNNHKEDKFFQRYYTVKGFEFPLIQAQRYSFIALELLPEQYHSQDKYVAYKKRLKAI